LTCDIPLWYTNKIEMGTVNDNYTLQWFNIHRATCFGFNLKSSSDIIKIIFILHDDGLWIKPRHDAWHALNHCRVNLCSTATIPPFLAINVTLTIVIFHFSCISFNISYIEGVLKWKPYV
jgi:hypothetical protein